MQALFTPSSLMFYSSSASSRPGWPATAGLQLAAAAYDPRHAVSAALYEHRLFTYEQLHSRPEHRLALPSVFAVPVTDHLATIDKRDAPKSFLIADILGIEDDRRVAKEVGGEEGNSSSGPLSPYSRVGVKRALNNKIAPRHNSFSSEHLHPGDLSPGWSQP